MVFVAYSISDHFKNYLFSTKYTTVKCVDIVGCV